VIVVGDALNPWIMGVNGQDTGVGFAVTTLTVAERLVPKNAPLALRIRHVPECTPIVPGVLIGTRRSAVAPGAVAGSATTVPPVIGSPTTKTNSSLVLHAQVPEFRTRQILLKT
jgi:hypothetical protein